MVTNSLIHQRLPQTQSEKEQSEDTTDSCLVCLAFAVIPAKVTAECKFEASTPSTFHLSSTLPFISSSTGSQVDFVNIPQLVNHNLLPQNFTSSTHPIF